MRDTDPPTLSQVPWEHPGGRIPGGVPTWPEARAPRQPTPSVAPTWNGHPIVLGISLMANGVLLASLVGVLFLAQAGAFAPPNSSRPSAPQGSALGSSNATPTPSLTPASGRLQVAPTSVQLGCDGGQQTQVVVLTNSGPEDVQWQVALDVSTNQAAVTISPRHGDLRAGTSVSIQIQNRNSNSAAQQGVIRFEPQTPTAEPAPSLSYTSSGCQGG